MNIEQLLRESEYFSGLNDTQINAILACASTCRFERGEYLVRQSDQDGAVFLLLSGRTEILVTQVGEEPTLEVIASIGAGEIVGERALLGMSRRSATVRARGPVETLRWDADQLRGLLSEHADIGATIMRALACRLSERLVVANNNLRNALTAQALL